MRQARTLRSRLALRDRCLRCTGANAAPWTTTQQLTVSSQIKNPITVGGRILDVFMEMYAITVIAGLAGAIGSFLQKRGQEIDEIR